MIKFKRISQEGVVFLLAVILFTVFAVSLEQFLAPANLISLVRSVSILGILSLGMAVVVIGRGIDLAIVATFVTAMSAALQLASSGMNVELALVIGLVFVVAVGLVIGSIVAFAEIPAVFTTLAMGSVVFGVGRTFFFSTDAQNTPPDVPWLNSLGFGTVLGVPAIIIAFGLMAGTVHLLLRWTIFGRYIYSIGDNPEAARLTGLPVRPVIVAQYVISGVIAFAAALVMAASYSGINARIYNSTLVYDVLLVVVLGGIGLSGGRGGVRNVLVGTLLVGVLLNGMTIMDVSFSVQNLIKSVMLLSALVADTIINPRDEQTS